MAFGIDIGPKMFLTLFTILASLVILYYIYKHRNDTIYLRLALSFILAGAVGNLIDRTFYGVIYNYASLFHGRVVDFIQIDTWDFTIFGRTYTTWPIFNVADISVTVGFLIILFYNNRIFKHDEESVTDIDIVPQENDSDGSSIEPAVLTENEPTGKNYPTDNDADGSAIENTNIQPPITMDEELNNKELNMNDDDGSPINKIVFQPSLEDDKGSEKIITEDKNNNPVIENKKDDTNTDPTGSEKT
jgi:signal peptidase II